MNMRFLLFAVIVCGMMAGCRNTKVETTPPEVTAGEAEHVSMQAAIDHYIADEIGSHYALGDMCIPSSIIVAVDSTAMDDVKVWGDFWVFHYNVSGDTLKTVSGGDHPGLMHLRRVQDDYEVTTFDAVGDGSLYLETAKRIFGDKFPAFQTISSDQDKKEEYRRESIAAYVKRNNLPVTKYQDYGWPAKEIFKADTIQ